MRTVCTMNSKYEIDYDNKRIRRVDGLNKPSPPFGDDGVWIDFHGVEDLYGRLVIIWGDTSAGKARCTATSKICVSTTVPAGK